MFSKRIVIYPGTNPDEPRLALTVVPRSLGINQQATELLEAWYKLDQWGRLSRTSITQLTTIAFIFSATVDFEVNPGEGDDALVMFQELLPVIRGARHDNALMIGNQAMPAPWTLDNGEGEAILGAILLYLVDEVLGDLITGYNKASFIGRPSKLFAPKSQLDAEDLELVNGEPVIDEDLEKKG